MLPIQVMCHCVNYILIPGLLSKDTAEISTVYHLLFLQIELKIECTTDHIQTAVISVSCILHLNYEIIIHSHNTFTLSDTKACFEYEYWDIENAID